MYHSAFIVRIKQYDTVTDHEDDVTTLSSSPIYIYIYIGEELNRP